MSLTEYCGPDFDRTQFFGAFWTPESVNLDDGMEELKKYLRQGNDFCKDIIDVFQQRWEIQSLCFIFVGCFLFVAWIKSVPLLSRRHLKHAHTRAALEDMYAKKLLGIYAKSLKIADATYGCAPSILANAIHVVLFCVDVV